ncbi:MAG: hypothetical protein MRY67_02715 [Rhodovulum sp.]|jgi:hypothetical protein|nr:hypothetical protein [Rhodovulum sp.]
MTKLAKITAVCIALMPAVAVAQDTTTDGTTEVIIPTDDELEVFRVAITDVGCTIADEETALTVEEATAYDEATLDAIVQQLRVYNEIVDASEEGGITLVTGDCAV